MELSNVLDGIGAVRGWLARGQVIPAHPLALTAARALDAMGEGVR